MSHRRRVLTAVWCSVLAIACSAGEVTDAEVALSTSVRSVLTDGLNLDERNIKPPIFIVSTLGLGEPRLDGPERPLTTDERTALADTLDDLGVIHFVDDYEQVLTGEGCKEVIDGGMVLTLWQVIATERRVEYEVRDFTACLAGGGWRVTVRRNGDEWRPGSLRHLFVS